MERRTRLAPRVQVVAVRDGEPVPYFGRPIRQAEEVFSLLKEDAALWDRERFLTLALDGRHRAIGLEEVSVGSMTASLIHPREVFKGLILANAAAFIAVHNHPSGDPAPSIEDREVTRRLKAAGELIGIPLLDHLVLATERFFSFASSGELETTNLKGGSR